MTGKSKLSCRKSKTKFAMCGLAPSCMNHRVCNGKPVARRSSTMYCTTCLNSAHCSLSLQRKLVLEVHDLRWRRHCNSTCMMHLLMNHTWILWCPRMDNLFVNHTIQAQVCLNRKPNIVELYSASLFWAHSANAILWCLFWTVS
jgi:hypothetical protein